MSLFSSTDLDSQLKPETELISLVKEIIFLLSSMDLDSQTELISLISKKLYVSSKHSYSKSDLLVILEPESELMSLIRQIFSLAISMDSEWGKLISVYPQVQVSLDEGKFHVFKEVSWKRIEKLDSQHSRKERVEFEVATQSRGEEFPWSINNKWKCLPLNWMRYSLARRDEDTHFRCECCNGENHKEYNRAPVEIKHQLHPKHSLQLALYPDYNTRMRQCYCCDEDLKEIFYYCSVCDYDMNIGCVEKPPVLSIQHPKWHEHPLSLFPRNTSLTCSVCALAHSTSCPFYICSPCDFVVHQRCISLPHVIRMSRHHHRINFTLSFDQGVWYCGVCRKKVDNDYGGYSCIKDSCSYAAHSKCATQSNVWDGIERENMPEELEVEVEPFVRISSGIIQHFRHPHHQLRLDEDTCRDYDENILCEACITPIYFGNFYSCMQCDYILHENCVKLSRKIYHPVHPHMVTLVRGYYDDVGGSIWCSICHGLCIAEFLYKCPEERCHFQLHVQCATISEPLVHGSHMYPLYLTSKPGEKRICSVCKISGHWITNETFNCIEECEFALCFGCATIPHTVRYRHDKHILTLFHGEETSTMTYWCESCEGKIDPKERFYMCDEYCCVTLHIECLLGQDLYMKPGLSWFYLLERTCVVWNNHMSRPVCSFCKKRCPHKIFFEVLGIIYCSTICIFRNS